METVTLKRSGKPPLQFAGEVIAEQFGHIDAGKDRNRWHDLAIYHTEAGAYVVSIAYRTLWQGEQDVPTAEVCQSGPDVYYALNHCDPTEHVQGFPIGDHYAEKQARLLDDIRRRYANRVSELLAEAGSEFAETIQ